MINLQLIEGGQPLTGAETLKQIPNGSDDALLELGRRFDAICVTIKGPHEESDELVHLLLQERFRIEHAIQDFPATTIEGFRIKARLALQIWCEDTCDAAHEDAEWPSPLAWKIVEQLIGRLDDRGREVAGAGSVIERKAP